MPEERKKLTVPDLAQRKKAGEKVVMASIPDYPSAVWAERAGIDIAAVGDSLGMVSYGFPNTLPVMSHVGMCPHFVHQYGGFKLQGRSAAEAMRIVEDGIAIEKAGAVGFEIEAVPAAVAKAVDAAVGIFTFGIGAGSASCGQLLLAFDLLGVFDQFKPKFTKRYAQISEVAVDALRRFAAEVREGKFPDDEHSYGMKPEEEQELARLIARHKR